MSARNSHTLFFTLCALEGVAVIAALLSIPSEGGTLSPARLGLIAIALLISAGWIYANFRLTGIPNRLARPTFILLFALLSLTLGVVLFLFRYLDPDRFFSAYERLSPLLWYLLVLSIQLSLYLLYLYKGFHWESVVSEKSIYSYALVVFGILLLVYLFIAITNLGITPDAAYWGEPGVPLMGWQFALALIAGLTVLCLSTYGYKLDVVLPVLIYGITLAVCLRVPISVLKNSFYMPITSPAEVPYPYSDSAYYDQMSQSLLIGHPYQGVIPSRPLYIFLLTVLHLVFGQDYRLILIGQTFVLALIPVLLYYVGKKLHGRTAGLVIALFFIFRECNSLMISSQTRVTNTKMILVDLPTLLLLLFACLFTFRWLERRDWINAFVAGGMFGVLLLLRTQSVLILPFIFLAALIIFGWRNKAFYRDLLVFLAAMIITILPWVIHNYAVTGAFTFEADLLATLPAEMYRFQGNAAIQNLNTEGMGMGRILIEFALRDPKHVFGFIANHFLATQVNGLLALPLFKPYNGLAAPVNLYWMNWDGHLEWYNALLLIFYLAIISLGLGAAWKRWKWLGLLPLVFSIGYALATAMSRFSSWRYDYPADWVAYFYFGVGFAEALRQGAILFGSKTENEPPISIVSSRSSLTKSVALGAVFILIGVAPWAITNIASPRFADQSAQNLTAKITSIPEAPSREEIRSFDSQPHAFFQAGRLLYPRFFKQNDGLTSANPSSAFAIREYPRVGFFLLNQISTPAVFPTQQIPASFPHASDVIVLGCQKENYVEVRLIAFPELGTLYTSAPLSEPCTP